MRWPIAERVTPRSRASSSSGSSGGPVLNQYGEVTGIVQSQLKEGQNLNFAVPSLYLLILMSGEKGVEIVPTYR
jgi:serine protease Do